METEIAVEYLPYHCRVTLLIDGVFAAMYKISNKGWVSQVRFMALAIEQYKASGAQTKQDLLYMLENDYRLDFNYEKGVSYAKD